MADTTDAGAVQKMFARLATYMSKEDFKKGLLVCDKLLNAIPGDREVLRCKCLCLLNREQFDEALHIAGDDLSFERAYCMYRLGRLDEAQALLHGMAGESSTDLATHLEAQLLYRKGSYAEAATLYKRLLEGVTDRVDRELASNAAAAFASADCASEGLALLSRTKAKGGAGYELDYNTACAMIQAGDTAGAQARLRRAEAKCRETFDGDDDYTPEEADAEVAAVQVQLGYVLQVQGQDEAAEALYIEALRARPAAAVSLVASNNLLVLRKTRELFESYKRMRAASAAEGRVKLPLAHQRRVEYNRALLLLYMNKGEECRERLRLIEEREQDGGGALAPNDDDAVRPALVRAALLVRERKLAKCEELLKTHAVAAENEGKTHQALRLRLALAQIYLIQSKLELAVTQLRSLEALRNAPGVVATLVAILERMGDVDGAAATLAKAIESHDNMMDAESGVGADGIEEERRRARRVTLLMGQGLFFMVHKQYREAANVYKRVDGDGIGEVESAVRLKALASLVMATSHFDPSAAESKAGSLPMPRGIEALPSPEEIEAAGLPRDATTAQQRKEARAALSAAASRASVADSVGMGEDAEMEDTKDVVSELKRKAREEGQAARRTKKRKTKRERHLKSLRERGVDPQDPANAPDPERWLKRADREKSRKFRKRRGQRMTGGQGAGDMAVRDAEKFDVRAQQMKKEEEAKAKEAERKAAAEANRNKTKKGKKGKKGRR